jgi:hypothetical protein
LIRAPKRVRAAHEAEVLGGPPQGGNSGRR